jgi:outer membrane protein assembly factor BamA
MNYLKIYILLLGFISGTKLISQNVFNKYSIVQQIEITGNKKTKSYTILRECTFKIGDSLSFQEFVSQCKRSKEFIASTGLFVLIDVTPEMLPNGNLKATIEVKERFYIFPLPYFKIAERNINVWLKDENASLKRVNYGVKLKWNNFTGRKDNLDFEAFTGFNQLVSVRYRQPYATGSLTWGYNLGLSLGRTKQVFALTNNNQPVVFPNNKSTVFNKNFFNANIDFTYRKGLKQNHLLSFKFTKQSISDSLFMVNQHYYGNNKTQVSFLDVLYNYAFINIDYNPYPLRGTSFTAAIFTRNFSKAVNLAQVTLTSFNGIGLGKKWYYLNNAVVAARSVQKLPYLNASFMGYGSFYLRGLDRFVIDGNSGFVFKNTLVKEIVNTRFKIPIKARFIKAHQKLPLRIMGNVFNDYGYVNYRYAGNSRLNNKLLYTYGAGVDVLAAYDFIIKIQYSINQLKQGGFFFQAGVNF